jgi:hypothetical protein
MGRFEPSIVFEAGVAFAGWALAGVAGVLGWMPYRLSVPIAADSPTESGWLASE